MTLKIEVGKYYRTRDGRKVGPMVQNMPWASFPFDDGTRTGWAVDGAIGFTPGRSGDLIAEWTDEPEAAPIDNASPLRRHAEVERPAPDLTAITTPFGLLPPETQQALRDHGGPYEMYQREGWREIGPVWAAQLVYRVKPAPKRETVTIYGAPALGVQWVYTQCEHDTHRITFDLIDGKPDPASIRMEEL